MKLLRKKPKVLYVSCRGKLIRIVFSNLGCLFCTLGMTGTFIRSKGKHAAVCFTFEKSGDMKEKNKELKLYFSDTRRFGTLEYIELCDVSKRLSRIGPDLLSQYPIDFECFKKRFEIKRNQTLAQLLMNQSLISGIGNYLKSEILYRCRFAPNRKYAELDENEKYNLYITCLQTCRADARRHNIKLSTIPSLDEGVDRFKILVYSKHIAPCGGKIIKTMTLDRRNTHWVPGYQI